MWFENFKTIGKFYYGMGCKNPIQYPLCGWVFITVNTGTKENPYRVKWTEQGVMLHVNDDNGTYLDLDELGYNKETEMF